MKAVELSGGWSISKDSYSWVLILNEVRLKVNHKSKEKEEFVFNDKWYFPSIRKCLEKYADQSLKPCDSVQEMILRLDEVAEAIKGVDNTLFKPDVKRSK